MEPLLLLFLLRLQLRQALLVPLLRLLRQVILLRLRQRQDLVVWKAILQTATGPMTLQWVPCHGRWTFGARSQKENQCLSKLLAQACQPASFRGLSSPDHRMAPHHQRKPMQILRLRQRF